MKRLLLMALLLSGCGGGGNPPPNPAGAQVQNDTGAIAEYDLAGIKRITPQATMGALEAVE